MPNFYHRQRPMPPTPPDVIDDYSYRGCGQQLSQSQYLRPGHPDKMFDAPDAFDAFHAHPYHAPAAPLMHQLPPMNYTNMPTLPPPGLPIPASFGSIGAPVLPPINLPAERTAEKQSSSRRERQEEQRRNQQSKAEKTVGGVSAVLTYDMDEMTDYVAEMTQSIVIPGSPVSPAFRKFVSGLLSSTRLPSSTILLGMNYLARRMNMLNTPAPYKASDGQVWRMLTIALLLGSKFLDDNTFQNRSWSEVSGIPVAELNTLEHEWLVAIDWKLHVNLEKSEDFQCWLASWDSWCEEKKKQRSTALERLPPMPMATLPAPVSMIDTNVQRQRTQRKNYSPAQSLPSYNASQERHQSIYQAPQQSYDSFQLSPPSAPDSGPNTPDYNTSLRGGGWSYGSRYQRRQPQPAQIPYHPQAPNHAINYGPYQYLHNTHSIWNTPHGAFCNSACCSRYNDSYFMTPGYGQQTVAG